MTADEVRLLVEWLKFGWMVGTGLLATLAFVISWWSSKQRANKAALDRVEHTLNEKIREMSNSAEHEFRRIGERMDEQSRRITIAEEALKFAPKADDLDKLRDSISRLSENTARLEGTQEGLFRTVERMNQFLMEHGK